VGVAVVEVVVVPQMEVEGRASPWKGGLVPYRVAVGSPGFAEGLQVEEEVGLVEDNQEQEESGLEKESVSGVGLGGERG